MSKPQPLKEEDLAPYNAPQLEAMKEDIANRSFRIRMTGMLVTGLIAAAAIAAVFLIPGGLAVGASGAKAIFYGALALGGGVTTLVTMHEAKKLEIDEHFIQSYMSGKNHWGAGYRQEVAEHGYSAPPLAMSGPSLQSHARHLNNAPSTSKGR